MRAALWMTLVAVSVGCGRPVPVDQPDPSPADQQVPSVDLPPAFCSGAPRYGDKLGAPTGSVALSVDGDRVVAVEVKLSGKAPQPPCSLRWDLNLVLRPRAGEAPALPAATIELSGWGLARGGSSFTNICYEGEDRWTVGNGDGWFPACDPETTVDGRLAIAGSVGWLCLTVLRVPINAPGLAVEISADDLAARCP